MSFDEAKTELLLCSAGVYCCIILYRNISVYIIVIISYGGLYRLVSIWLLE